MLPRLSFHPMAGYSKRFWRKEWAKASASTVYKLRSQWIGIFLAVFCPVFRSRIWEVPAFHLANQGEGMVKLPLEPSILTMEGPRLRRMAQESSARMPPGNL